MNCFKPMLVIIVLLMVCTIVQGFNKPYLTVDNNHQIVFVTDVNGAEVRQPFHISGVGLYSEVADERTIGSNGDIQTAIIHIAAARNRMLRLFCCHFSDVPYQDVPELHVPFKRSGATFDVTGFNLSSQYPEKHDTDWRSRLRAAIDKAKDPDGDAATQDAVIIQLSLFDHCDLVGEGWWPSSVWNGNNNNSGNGGVQIIRDSAKGNGMPYFFLTDPDDAFIGSDDSWTLSEN